MIVVKKSVNKSSKIKEILKATSYPIINYDSNQTLEYLTVFLFILFIYLYLKLLKTFYLYEPSLI